MTNKELIEFKKLIAKHTLLANEHKKTAEEHLKFVKSHANEISKAAKIHAKITRAFAAKVTAKKQVVCIEVLFELRIFLDSHLN